MTSSFYKDRNLSLYSFLFFVLCIDFLVSLHISSPCVFNQIHRETSSIFKTQFSPPSCELCNFFFFFQHENGDRHVSEMPLLFYFLSFFLLFFGAHESTMDLSQLSGKALHGPYMAHNPTNTHITHIHIKPKVSCFRTVRRYKMLLSLNAALFLSSISLDFCHVNATPTFRVRFMALNFSFTFSFYNFSFQHLGGLLLSNFQRFSRYMDDESLILQSY